MHSVSACNHLYDKGLHKYGYYESWWHPSSWQWGLAPNMSISEVYHFLLLLFPKITKDFELKPNQDCQTCKHIGEGDSDNMVRIIWRPNVYLKKWIAWECTIRYIFIFQLIILSFLWQFPCLLVARMVDI